MNEAFKAACHRWCKKAGNGTCSCETKGFGPCERIIVLVKNQYTPDNDKVRQEYNTKHGSKTMILGLDLSMRPLDDG